MPSHIRAASDTLTEFERSSTVNPLDRGTTSYGSKFVLFVEYHHHHYYHHHHHHHYHHIVVSNDKSVASPPNSVI